MKFTAEATKLQALVATLGATVSVVAPQTINLKFTRKKRKENTEVLLVEMVGEKAYGKALMSDVEFDSSAKDAATSVLLDSQFVTRLPLVGDGKYNFSTDKSTLLIDNSLFKSKVEVGDDKTWLELSVGKDCTTISLPFESVSELLNSVPHVCNFAQPIKLWQPHCLVRITFNGKTATLESTDSNNACLRTIELTNSVGNHEFLIPADWLRTWPSLVSGGTEKDVTLSLNAESSMVEFSFGRWKVTHATNDGTGFKPIKSFFDKAKSDEHEYTNDLVVDCAVFLQSIVTVSSFHTGDVTIVLQRSEKSGNFIISTINSQADSKLSVGKVGKEGSLVLEVEKFENPITVNRRSWELLLRAGLDLAKDKKLRLRSDGKMVLANNDDNTLLIATTEKT